MEKIGYILLAVAGVGLSVLLLAEIDDLWVGVFLVMAIVGFGVLLVKVVRDRRANKEDDHYAKTVDR
jgi:hypothetical protein